MATAADTTKMRQACSVFLQAGARAELEELRAKLAEQADKIKELEEQVAWNKLVEEAKASGAYDDVAGWWYGYSARDDCRF